MAPKGSGKDSSNKKDGSAAKKANSGSVKARSPEKGINVPNYGAERTVIKGSLAGRPYALPVDFGASRNGTFFAYLAPKRNSAGDKEPYAFPLWSYFESNMTECCDSWNVGNRVARKDPDTGEAMPYCPGRTVPWYQVYHIPRDFPGKSVTVEDLRRWVDHLCSEWNKLAKKIKGEQYGFKYDVHFRVGSLVTSFTEAQAESEFFIDRDVANILLETYSSLTVDDVRSNRNLVEGYFGEDHYDAACDVLGHQS
jgi:hypothetical protein